MHGNAVQWTPDMDQVIINYWHSPKSREDIADRIGVALNTATARAKALGFRRKPGKRPVRYYDHPRISREMIFAQHLADGLSIERDWAKMGFSSRASANASLQRLRKKLGEQAV